MPGGKKNGGGGGIPGGGGPIPIIGGRGGGGRNGGGKLPSPSGGPSPERLKKSLGGSGRALSSPGTGSSFNWNQSGREQKIRIFTRPQISLFSLFKSYLQKIQ